VNIVCNGVPAHCCSDELFEGDVPYLETVVYGRSSCHQTAQLRTVPDADGPFLLFVAMQIAFGCFYQGIRKLLFRRRLQRPRLLRAFLLLLLLPLLQMLLLLLLPPSTAGASAVGADVATRLHLEAQDMSLIPLGIHQIVNIPRIVDVE
jgi:hypothetical protein